MKSFLMRSHLLMTCLILSACTSMNQIEVQPRGQFATIEVERSITESKKLLKNDKLAIQRVLASPSSYNPGVLYALAKALFETGRQDDAMFWFYTGQLRARSDANKCLDLSARQGVAALNQRFGTPINQYALKDIPKLRSTVLSVVQKERSLPRNYDQRWLALHGTDAFNRTEIRMESESKWSQINETTRNHYVEEFEKALKLAKLR